MRIKYQTNTHTIFLSSFIFWLYFFFIIKPFCIYLMIIVLSLSSYKHCVKDTRVSFIFIILMILSDFVLLYDVKKMNKSSRAIFVLMWKEDSHCFVYVLLWIFNVIVWLHNMYMMRIFILWMFTILRIKLVRFAIFRLLYLLLGQ